MNFWKWVLDLLLLPEHNSELLLPEPSSELLLRWSLGEEMLVTFTTVTKVYILCCHLF